MSSRSKRGSPESRPWSHGHFDAAAPSRTPKLARFEIDGSSVVTVVIPGLRRPLTDLDDGLERHRAALAVADHPRRGVTAGVDLIEKLPRRLGDRGPDADGRVA